MAGKSRADSLKILTMVFVLVLVLDVTTYWSARRVHVSNDRVKHTYQVQHELDEMLLALQATELSMRSYLVTETRRLTVDNQALKENLHRLEEQYRLQQSGSVAALILGLGIRTVQRVQATKERRAAEALADGADRFRSVAALYDHGSGAVRDYLARVVDGLVRLLPGETAVHRMCDIEDYLMDAKLLSTLGLVVNELVTNVLKYALPGRGSGQLAVTLARRDGTVVEFPV